MSVQPTLSEDGYFDERVAARYDESIGGMSTPAAVDPAVAFLAGLAGAGPVLELAIGTGRIALPLAQKGLAVHGIDLSRAMVARLRQKPGGADIPVTIGDLAATRVAGEFSLVYLVFNTIMNLTKQSEQVACFRNAANHLQPRGCFVLEVGVPDLRRLPPGVAIRGYVEGDQKWGFDEYDVADQGLISHHFEAVDSRVELFSAPFRFVWPSELDLMAEMAGMALRERWANWQREAFTSDSDAHVSVWEKP